MNVPVNPSIHLMCLVNITVTQAMIV